MKNTRGISHEEGNQNNPEKDVMNTSRREREWSQKMNRQSENINNMYFNANANASNGNGNTNDHKNLHNLMKDKTGLLNELNNLPEREINFNTGGNDNKNENSAMTTQFNYLNDPNNRIVFDVNPKVPPQSQFNAPNYNVNANNNPNRRSAFNNPNNNNNNSNNANHPQKFHTPIKSRNTPSKNINHDLNNIVKHTQGNNSNRDPFGSPGNFINPLDVQNRKKAVSDNYLEQIDQRNNSRAIEKNKQKVDDEKYLNDMINYYPFGKGGAGAPNRDKFGNVMTNRKKLISDPRYQHMNINIEDDYMEVKNNQHNQNNQNSNSIGGINFRNIPSPRKNDIDGFYGNSLPMNNNNNNNNYESQQQMNDYNRFQPAQQFDGQYDNPNPYFNSNQQNNYSTSPGNYNYNQGMNNNPSNYISNSNFQPSYLQESNSMPNFQNPNMGGANPNPNPYSMQPLYNNLRSQTPLPNNQYDNNYPTSMPMMDPYSNPHRPMPVIGMANPNPYPYQSNNNPSSNGNASQDFNPISKNHIDVSISYKNCEIDGDQKKKQRQDYGKVLQEQMDKKKNQKELEKQRLKQEEIEEEKRLQKERDLMKIQYEKEQNLQKKKLDDIANDNKKLVQGKNVPKKVTIDEVPKTDNTQAQPRPVSQYYKNSNNFNHQNQPPMNMNDQVNNNNYHQNNNYNDNPDQQQQPEQEQFYQNQNPNFDQQQNNYNNHSNLLFEQQVEGEILKLRTNLMDQQNELLRQINDLKSDSQTQNMQRYEALKEIGQLKEELHKNRADEETRRKYVYDVVVDNNNKVNEIYSNSRLQPVNEEDILVDLSRPRDNQLENEIYEERVRYPNRVQKMPDMSELEEHSLKASSKFIDIDSYHVHSGLNVFEPVIVREKDKARVNKLKHRAIELDDDFETIVTNMSYINKKNKQNKNNDVKVGGKLYSSNFQEQVEEQDLEEDTGIEENLGRNKKILIDENLSIHQIYNKNIDRLKQLNKMIESSESFKPSYKNKSNYESKENKENRENREKSYDYNDNDLEDNSFGNLGRSQNNDDFDNFISKLNNIKVNERESYDY